MEKFDVTCRTCNTERSNLVSLTSNARGNDDLKMSEMLLLVCPSLAGRSHSRLPEKICYFCSKQLEIAYNFQIQCERSHEELLKLLDVRIKAEPVPDDDIRTSPGVKTDGSDGHTDIDDLVSRSITTGDLEVHENSQLDEEANSNGNSQETEALDDKAEKLEEDFEEGSIVSETMEYLLYDEEMTSVDEELKSNQSHLPENEVSNKQTANSSASFACCHCEKEFLSEKGLILHKKLAHKTLKPVSVLVEAEILTIECKYCSEVFEWKSELISHCRLNHRTEEEAEYKCSICLKSFSCKNRFDHHSLYHRNCRYRCPGKNCDRHFVIKYKLIDHLKRFHGITLTNSQKKELKPCDVASSTAN